MLAQKKYKKRHDNVCSYIYWKLCEKLDFQRAQQWHEHEPDRVIENKRHKILWDFTIQCDTKIEGRRSDVVVIDKTKTEVKIADITIPGDERVKEKKVGKIEKYKLLKDEITRIWGHEGSDCNSSTCRCIRCNIQYQLALRSILQQLGLRCE